MLTKNYWNAFKAQMEQSMIQNALKTPSGNIVNAGSRAYNALTDTRWLFLESPWYSFQTTNSGFVIGSGSTPATEDDYAMDHLITSGFSSPSGMWADNGLHLFVNNTGNSSLTISEIGLCASIATVARTTYTGGGTNVLIMRTVLETPIVLAPGETAEIIIKLEFELPETSA